MGEITDITVIIPIHLINDEVKPLIANAVESVKKQKVMVDSLLFVVAANNGIKEYIEKEVDTSGISIKIIENDGETDFASQFNLGVKEAKTTWVGLLEFDDELSDNWSKNGLKYIKAYKDVEFFLPLIVDVNHDGNFISLANEAVWANGFSDSLGLLDHETLLTYQNFNFGGMLIKKELYEDFGGIKSSIKLLFMYEFFLRMTHFGVKTMVIPKIGYKHMNNRAGSLFNEYKVSIDPVEAKWWLSLAKRECHQPKDRNITYEKNGD